MKSEDDSRKTASKIKKCTPQSSEQNIMTEFTNSLKCFQNSIKNGSKSSVQDSTIYQVAEYNSSTSAWKVS